MDLGSNLKAAPVRPGKGGMVYFRADNIELFFNHEQWGEDIELMFESLTNLVNTMFAFPFAQPKARTQGTISPYKSGRRTNLITHRSATA